VYNALQIGIMQKGFECNLTEEQINFISRLDKNEKPVYNAYQMKMIVNGLDNCFSLDEISVYTKVNNEDKPIYSEYQMHQIYDGLCAGFTNDEINLYAKVNTDNIPIYDHNQMACIREGVESSFSIEQINEYAKLNKNGEPIYDNNQMTIISWYIPKLDIEQIRYFTKLDDNEKPIYHPDEMREIAIGFSEKLSTKKIEVYSKLNKQGKPIFNSDKMMYIRQFFKEANEKQFNVIKNCIETNISYGKFSKFMDPEIPVDKMRIYRWMCSKFNTHQMDDLIKLNLSYEQLKDSKYILQCLPFGSKAHDTESVEDFFIKNMEETDKDFENMLYLAENFVKLKHHFSDKYAELFRKSLSYRVSPEIIKDAFYTRLSMPESKETILAALNGLSAQDIKEVLREKEYLEIRGISISLKEKYEEKLKEKICIESLDDEPIFITKLEINQNIKR
jgi:hypothetical protein